MLFGRHDDGEAAQPHPVSVVRDVVEIVAIVLAGIWAFYSFIYVERIKPYEDPGTMVVDVSLDRAGSRGGVAALRERLAFTNPGKIQLRILGIAQTLTSHVVSADTTRRAAGAAVRRSSAVITTEHGLFQNSGDPSLRDSFTLNPGETWHSEKVFYVREGRFDDVQATLMIGFTKYVDRIVPVEAVPLNGLTIIRCSTPNRSCGLDGETATATVSFWK